MNVAFFSSHILMPSHYETELELIANHLAQGDAITQLVCEASLSACDTNPYFSPEACSRCIAKRKKGANLLPASINTKHFLNLTDEDRKQIAAVQTEFTSVSELQKLRVNNFDIGYAVASSIISMTRDTKPDLEKPLLQRYIQSALAVYFSTINYLKDQKPDVMYVFNGRFAHTKAVFRACQSLGVTCRLHERGNSLNYYSVFENTGIHDAKFFQEEIESNWQKADVADRESIAHKWFQTRIGGTMENWYSFLKDQTFDLPDGWDESKTNILICNSSEDEIASLGKEWEHPIYPSQPNGIMQIVNDCATNSNLHFYLRIHPYLAKVDNDDVRELHALSYPNLTVIPASSKMSTYKLVEKTALTITFGSTIGVEATYMGKPSILLSRSFYDRLNVTYFPNNHSETIALLNARLEAKPMENALKFGYYSATFGSPFKHYTPEDFGRGKFNGVDLSLAKSRSYWLTKLIYHNSWFPKLSQKLSLRKRDLVLRRFTGHP
jgi:hypothetical protein